MATKAAFDGLVTLRTVVLTAIIGFLAGYYPEVKTVPEVSAAIGGIIGGVYDVIAFYVKSRFVGGPAEGGE